MQILAIEKEVAPLDSQRHREVLREEAACVWELKKKEVIRDIWFTTPGRHAVVMLECSSKEEAQRHLASLPLVREGLITFEVMALRSYDGFDRLVTAERQTPNLPVQPTPGSAPCRV
jgi:muconolactone delta-isomerase